MPAAVGPAIALAVLVTLLAAVVTSVRSPRRRRRLRLAATRLVGGLMVTYLVGRAIVEVFAIDVGDPDTYRHDWGGPHLAGVLAVHCGPGLLVLIAVGAIVRARRAASWSRSAS